MRSREPRGRGTHLGPSTSWFPSQVCPQQAAKGLALWADSTAETAWNPSQTWRPPACSRACASCVLVRQARWPCGPGLGSPLALAQLQEDPGPLRLGFSPGLPRTFHSPGAPALALRGPQSLNVHPPHHLTPPHTHTQLPHRAQASPKTRRIGKRVPLDGSIAPKMPTCPSSPQRSLRPLLRKKRQALSSMLQDGGSLTWHLGTALGHLQLLPGWPLQSQGPQRDGGPFAQASATRRQWRPLQAACPQAQGRASLAKPLATCLGQMMATWPAHCPRGDILTWALLCLLNTHVERRGRGGGGGVG